MNLLVLACRKKDGGCPGNTSTDKEGCVGVVYAVTGRAKHPTVTGGKQNFLGNWRKAKCHLIIVVMILQ